MSSVREFAARIARLERGVTALGTAPQLGHSSLDDESVNVYDEDGNQKARVGLQHDGTYTAAELDGPIPPVPGVPTVEGGQGSLTVSWDGGYTDDARAPLDFRLVEIYAAPAPFTERADATLLGHFSNEAGGELSVARPVGEWHVGLVTKAESGRRSDVSALAVGTVTSMIDQDIFDDLENRLDGLGDDLGDLVTTIIPGLKDTINGITGVTLPALDNELDQAKSDIIDAFGAASDAASDASNAQDTADAAALSAAEAVGMISGMGTVLFQDEQPDAEHENDSTLWIDTTDGVNVSKRWDGTEWKIVRDPAIVDAVDKAIAAKQAADEAKQAADAALALAGTAEGNAQLAIVAAAGAQSSADGVAKNLFSTSEPSGQAPYGSIWFQVDGSGRVIGQWQQTTPGIRGTWTVRAIRSEVIANLDVGKLTAGTAAVGTLVAQKIAVAVATIIELHADQITAGTIDTERLNAVAIAAAVGTFLELRADQITASGAGFDVAVINQLFADMFVAHKITAEEMDVASLVADGAFIASLVASEVLSQQLVLRSGDDGWLSQVSGEGLRTFTPEGEAAIQLGRFDAALDEDNDVGLTLYESLPLLDDDSNPILDDDGVPMTSVAPVASMNDRGEIAGKDVSASETFSYRGDELAELFEERPLGLIYKAFHGSSRSMTTLGGYSYIVFDARSDRAYKVTAEVRARNRSGRGVELSVRAKDSNIDDPPGVPSVANSLVDDTSSWVLPAAIGSTGNGFQNYEFSFAYSPGGTVWKNASVLLCAEPAFPTGTASGDLEIGPVRWRVEDMGLADVDGRIQSGGSYSDSGGGSSGGASQPPTTTPKRTYTKTYGYDWHRSWQQNGARPSQIQNAAYQGYTKYYPAAGLYRSMVGIKSMTGDLSGATIKKVQVRVRMDHSYSNAGGTVVIGTHGWNGRPGSWSDYDVDIVRSKFSRGQEKWITLPSSTWQGFKDGSRRGICFYSGSTSSTYYCQMAPGRVAVKITYEK